MADTTVLSRFRIGHLVFHRCVPGAARWDAQMGRCLGSERDGEARRPRSLLSALAAPTILQGAPATQLHR